MAHFRLCRVEYKGTLIPSWGQKDAKWNQPSYTRNTGWILLELCSHSVILRRAVSLALTSHATQVCTGESRMYPHGYEHKSLSVAATCVAGLLYPEFSLYIVESMPLDNKTSQLPSSQG